MQKIKVDFVDFGGLDKINNIFMDILSLGYNVEINDNPDLLFFSDIGGSSLHKTYSCKKVFWTGESNFPDYNYADASFCPLEIDDPRNLRMPYYAFSTRCNSDGLVKKSDFLQQIIEEKRRNCSFVVSNIGKRAKYRIDFYDKLRRVIDIDSGGRALNTIGGPVSDKIGFLKKYKFNLAFENKMAPGYTTEKIVDAMLAHALPIYYGNPNIDLEFNSKSFINVSGFMDIDEAVEYIVQVDSNSMLYEEYLSQPYFIKNEPNQWFNKNLYLNFLRDFIDTDVKKRKKVSVFGRWVVVKGARK